METAKKTLKNLLDSWKKFVDNCEDPSPLKGSEQFTEPLEKILERRK